MLALTLHVGRKAAINFLVDLVVLNTKKITPATSSANDTVRTVLVEEIL